jgi:hypothetical protein
VGPGEPRIQTLGDIPVIRFVSARAADTVL